MTLAKPRIGTLDLDIWQGRLARLRPRVATAHRDGAAGTLSHTFGGADQEAPVSTVRVTVWTSGDSSLENAETRLRALIGQVTSCVDGDGLTVPAVLILDVMIESRRHEHPSHGIRTSGVFQRAVRRLTATVTMQVQPAPSATG